MTDDNQITVVLGSVKHGVHIDGAMMIIAGCGHHAWMSENAARLLTRNDDAVTKCDGCLEPGELLGSQFNEVPGAVEEAAHYLGVPESEIRATLAALAAQHGGEIAPHPEGMK